MSHEVETMMYAGETPWHGLGVRVPAEVTSAEALQKAGLDWRVDLKKVQVLGSKAVDGYRAVVRSTDKKVLGIVSDIYQPLQNEKVCEVLDSIVGEGHAYYHTAGSLNGGVDVWFLLKLPTELRLGDDLTEDYLLATTGHNGKRGFRILPTKIRVVCQNTLTQALTGAAGGVYMTHFGNPEARIAAARKVLSASAQMSEEFNTVAQRLYAYKYSAKQLQELAAEMFPERTKADEGEGEEEHQVHWLVQKNRDKIVELFDGGKGHDKIAGTAWAALNAVAEYTDWVRGKDSNNRLDAAWFGEGAKMKKRALQVITRQMAA